jgi:hypothetical protein
MKYETQLEILTLLAYQLAPGTPRSAAHLIEQLEAAFGTCDPRPESFASLLAGATARGWIEVAPGGGYLGTGALWMFMRAQWHELGDRFVALRAAIGVLVDEIVERRADELHEITGFAPSLDIGALLLAWSALLAAAPGLAAQMSAAYVKGGSPVIQFAPTMLDRALLLKIVDLPRDRPGAMALPLEVRA